MRLTQIARPIAHPAEGDEQQQPLELDLATDDVDDEEAERRRDRDQEADGREAGSLVLAFGAARFQRSPWVVPVG
jgi:hypothetical protein